MFCASVFKIYFNLVPSIPKTPLTFFWWYIYLCGGGLVTKLCLTLVTSWSVVRQASLSMAFPRQEFWSTMPFPSPGNLPDSGTKLVSLDSPAFQVGSLLLRLQGRYSVYFFHLHFISNICPWNEWGAVLTIIAFKHILHRIEQGQWHLGDPILHCSLK